MAIIDDYRAREERAQEDGFAQSKTAEVPTHGLLYQWQQQLEHYCDQTADLANRLRAYRLAIAGPDERLTPIASTQTLERPANPSKVQGIEDTLADLGKQLETAILAYEELAKIGLVRDGDYYF